MTRCSLHLMAGPRLPKYRPETQGDRRLLPDAEREAFNRRVQQLREEGLPAIHIANVLGVSTSTLTERVKKPRSHHG